MPAGCLSVCLLYCCTCVPYTSLFPAARQCSPQFTLCQRPTTLVKTRPVSTSSSVDCGRCALLPASKHLAYTSTISTTKYYTRPSSASELVRPSPRQIRTRAPRALADEAVRNRLPGLQHSSHSLRLAVLVSLWTCQTHCSWLGLKWPLPRKARYQITTRPPMPLWRVYSVTILRQHFCAHSRVFLGQALPLG